MENYKTPEKLNQRISFHEKYSVNRQGCDETPDEAERKGLGTPATRAGIIEKLVRIGFIERKDPAI